MATLVTCGRVGQGGENIGYPASAPPPGFGQGKRVATILADQGDIVTMVSDTPFHVRSRHVTDARAGTRGVRTMHRTTLKIPTQSYTSYTTTSHTNFGGSVTLEPAERPQPYPSQHTSQIALGGQQRSWNTDYKSTFIDKDVQPARQLHQPSFENKLLMAEGAGLKRVVTSVVDGQSGNRCWSQYNRVHNKLGAMLGPGEPRERPVRQAYNPVTGAHQGPAWKESNRRVSANRVLLHHNYTPSAPF